MTRESLLIPVRRRLKLAGEFRWPRETALAGADKEDELPLRQLAGDLAKSAIRAFVRTGPVESAALRMRREGRIGAPEAYRLTISPNGVEVHSSAPAGAYYALQTLRELTTLGGRTLPCCVIDDRPDFPRRGAYLDCARGKVPKLSTLKALVERLARWKANELQLYIENAFAFRRHPDIWKGCSPFTAAEIRSLQEHCRKHHVRLVGSLASFGHMEKVLALPRYRRLGELPGFGGFPGGTTLCPGDAGSVRLMRELYEEFVPLFEARDFNACCDETAELGRGRSRRRAERVGVGRVYLEFLLKIRRLLLRHGKRMNAWADIVLEHPELPGELPLDVVMLNWEYNADGPRISRTGEIAEAGLPFMVCPGTSSWQTHGTRLANAVANVARFAAAGRKFGAEGLLNTDWGDSGHRNFLSASLHGLAHGAAHAWCGRGVDDASFTETFCLHAFGDRAGRLARAIRALGRSYLDCGAPHGNECALYHALVEPLLPPAPSRSRIDATDAEGLRTIISNLSAPGLWPAHPVGLGEFEEPALRELALAARMDALAARRAIAGKLLRVGISPPRRELKQLAEDMGRLADDFRTLWLARNKTSRLRDNLRLFRRARLECEKLGR